MEYIYLLDIAWKVDEVGSVPFEEGSVVINVVKKENDSFEFLDPISGEIFCTNYGWSLVENTSKNVERLNEYLKSRDKLRELEKKTKELRTKVVDLDGPSRLMS